MATALPRRLAATPLLRPRALLSTPQLRRPAGLSSLAKLLPNTPHNSQRLGAIQQARTFSCSRKLAAISQEAPSAKAYLASGVIAGSRDLVDVKKVLVIGSGGLSIGQAGEFDYSGEFFFSL